MNLVWGTGRDRVGADLAAGSIAPGAMFGGRVPRGGAGVGAFVLAIVTAGALAHVGVRIRGLQVGYDLGTERRIASELEEQKRRLQIEIGMLKDPGRVISIAREKLNMAPPPPEAIWRLGAGALQGGAAALETGAVRRDGALGGGTPVAGAGRSTAAAPKPNQVPRPAGSKGVRR